MLDHYWLKMIPSYDTHMTKNELKEYLMIHKMKRRQSSSSKEENSSSEYESADSQEDGSSGSDGDSDEEGDESDKEGDKDDDEDECKDDEADIDEKINVKITNSKPSKTNIKNEGQSLEEKDDGEVTEEQNSDSSSDEY